MQIADSASQSGTYTAMLIVQTQDTRIVQTTKVKNRVRESHTRPRGQSIFQNNLPRKSAHCNRKGARVRYMVWRYSVGDRFFSYLKKKLILLSGI